MKTKYGVSSITPSNKRLKNGYTMYDWVMRQKCFPAFWGRTLLGEGAVTEEEISFLKEEHCKIFLVIRDLSEKSISGASGTKDALRAVDAAKQLGVPQNKNIALFAEIQPKWSINHNWMISFAHTIFANGYIPRFIANTDSSKNFNFDRQRSHFVEATKDENCFGALFMASEPQCNEPPEQWTPFCPSALNAEDIRLWCCGKTTFDELEVSDVYINDKRLLDNMWER